MRKRTGPSASIASQSAGSAGVGEWSQSDPSLSRTTVIRVVKGMRKPK